MGYFPVRYNSRVIIYDCRGFIRLATGPGIKTNFPTELYLRIIHLTCIWYVWVWQTVALLEKIEKVLFIHNATACHSFMLQMQLVWMILSRSRNRKIPISAEMQPSICHSSTCQTQLLWISLKGLMLQLLEKYPYTSSGGRFRVMLLLMSAPYLRYP